MPEAVSLKAKEIFLIDNVVVKCRVVGSSRLRCAIAGIVRLLACLRHNVV